MFDRTVRGIGPRAWTAIAILALAVVAVFSVLHTPSSRTDEMPKHALAIGEISSLFGDVSRRWPAQTELAPAQPKENFVSGELLMTGVNSEASITFKSGARLHLDANTRVVAEVDSSRGGDAVRATLLDGEADVVEKGAADSFSLFSRGREITNGRAIERLVIPSPMAGGSLEGGTLAGDSAPVAALPPAETPTPLPARVGSADVGGDVKPGEGGLTNDEIRKGLRGQAGFFQRCYLAYVNRKRDTTAKPRSVTVGFTIANSGKITTARLVRSDFTDPTLNNCVLESVQRTSFRPFTGDAIPVLEFPIQLQ